MFFAIMYVFSLIMYCAGVFRGIPLEGNYEFLTVTNTLIAFGIISICKRLDELIKKMPKS